MLAQLASVVPPRFGDTGGAWHLLFWSAMHGTSLSHLLRCAAGTGPCLTLTLALTLSLTRTRTRTWTRTRTRTRARALSLTRHGAVPITSARLGAESLRCLLHRAPRAAQRWALTRTRTRTRTVCPTLPLPRTPTPTPTPTPTLTLTLTLTLTRWAGRLALLRRR